MRDLPWMGLGLSTNLGPTDRPQPWAMHDRDPSLFDYVEYSAPLRLDQARRSPRFEELLRRRHELPAVFHPVHLNLWGPKLESKENLDALREHLAEVGSPWVGNDVAWWHHEDRPFPGYLFVAPPMTKGALSQCATHAFHVQEGAGAPLLLENPVAIAVEGELHVLDFMAELHGRTSMGLILDLGHLFAHQLSRDLPLQAGFDGFPFEAVAEIHIAGGVVTKRQGRRFYYDDHGQPVREELFALLEEVLPRCTGLRAVTFEADGHPEPVARRTLNRLRALIPRSREVSGKIGSPKVAAASEAEGPDPWRVFARAWQQEEGGGDAVARRADMDYRLAILSQELDGDWPLTRLLLAGDREGLLAFARSEEFTRHFEDGRSLADAFGNWARRRIGGAPGVDAVVALETWARSRPEGEAIFPVDLSELVFGAMALRRHLTDRAWACGLLEAEGMGALRQLAARPGPGPWRVLVRREGGRLRIHPLENQT